MVHHVRLSQVAAAYEVIAHRLARQARGLFQFAEKPGTIRFWGRLANRRSDVTLNLNGATIMNVPLSENWRRFVREEVETGRFPSEAAVVEEALGLLKRREDDHAESKAGNGAGRKSIGEIIDEFMSDLPEDVLERLPADGAAQHDHYIYGTPKRPS